MRQGTAHATNRKTDCLVVWVSDRVSLGYPRLILNSRNLPASAFLVLKLPEGATKTGLSLFPFYPSTPNWRCDTKYLGEGPGFPYSKSSPLPACCPALSPLLSELQNPELCSDSKLFTWHLRGLNYVEDLRLEPVSSPFAAGPQ